MGRQQMNLFEAAGKSPQGFAYQAELVSVKEERELVEQFKSLPFKEFQFHGFEGKRRVVSFGWRYDFSERELLKANDIPTFLLPLREKAARFAELDPPQLQHVLVTEYTPGAAIGWHKDKAVFDRVVGVSLVNACRFRFRRRVGENWERAEVI